MELGPPDGALFQTEPSRRAAGQPYRGGINQRVARGTSRRRRDSSLARGAILLFVYAGIRGRIDVEIPSNCSGLTLGLTIMVHFLTATKPRRMDLSHMNQ